MVSAPQRRAGADHLRLKGVSQRRCARLLNRSRSSLRYRRRPLAQDEIAGRVQVLAQANPRYGYRRVWALVRREGRLVNIKKVHRVFKCLGLQVRRTCRICSKAEGTRYSRNRMNDLMAARRTFRLLGQLWR